MTIDIIPAPEVEGHGERRCPCAHLIKLAGQVDKEISAVSMGMGHCKESLEQRIADIVEGFSESNLQIKECLTNLQTSAAMLVEGAHRFKDLETMVMASTVERDKRIAEEKKEREADMKGLTKTAKRDRFWLVIQGVCIVALLAVNLLNGHAATIGDTLSAIGRAISAVRPL